MSKALTIQEINALKPDPTKRREVADGGNLFLVIQPSGARSWAYRYRAHGKPAKLTLGPYRDAGPDEDKDRKPEIGDALTLKEARRLRDKVAAAAHDGRITPASKAPRPTRDGDLLADVVDQFIARKRRDGKRTAGEYERLLKKLVLPVWPDMTIQELRKRDVIALLDGLTDPARKEGHGAMKGGGAVKVFAVVRALFNFAVARDMLQLSPCAGVQPPAVVASRDRVLSDDEARKKQSIA
jgi:hypothetical protein